MEFKGTLFTYDKYSRLVAFESEDGCDSDTCLIFVGGLGDGFNAVPFIPLLQQAVHGALGISLIQIFMTSSYSGYGSVTLEDDSQEIDTLLDHLVTQRQKKKFVILGHSTGSQDCYWHNKNGKHREKVVAYILQAPVSDREFGEAAIPKFADQVALAKKMVDEHREQEWMSRSISDVPITATRYVALGDRLGQDDVFSGDLTEDELDRLYDGLTQPMMLVHGSEDEFYKSPVDQMELLERLQRACPAIQKIAVVSGGDHSLTDPTAAEAFVDLVISFLEPLL